MRLPGIGERDERAGSTAVAEEIDGRDDDMWRSVERLYIQEHRETSCSRVGRPGCSEDSMCACGEEKRVREVRGAGGGRRNPNALVDLPRRFLTPVPDLLLTCSIHGRRRSIDQLRGPFQGTANLGKPYMAGRCLVTYFSSHKIS